MSNMNYKRTIVLLAILIGRGIPLHIRCPLRDGIWDDILDKAFQRKFEQHGDLQCLHCLLWRAFRFACILLEQLQGKLLPLII